MTYGWKTCFNLLHTLDDLVAFSPPYAYWKHRDLIVSPEPGCFGGAILLVTLYGLWNLLEFHNYDYIKTGTIWYHINVNQVKTGLIWFEATWMYQSIETVVLSRIIVCSFGDNDCLLFQVLMDYIYVMSFFQDTATYFIFGSSWLMFCLLWIEWYLTAPCYALDEV